MDRIKLKSLIAGQEVELQFDKKAMPGEAGPCFMITADGCFKGYFSLQKNGGYKPLGASYYTGQDLQQIAEQIIQYIQ
jgi:hypothetical protein